MKKPDFFLVGAPKCGTTSMCHYLSRHPSIFICDPKEPHYFGSPPGEHTAAKNIEEYLNLFSGGHDLVCGEASTSYLYTEKAAEAIYALNPDAKIIIMLRDPVELLYSWHSELLFLGYENIDDFRLALEAEPERSLGKRIPRRCRSPRFLLYRQVVQFTEHIQRYQKLFGRELVNIIIFDDLKDDTTEVFRKTLEFLKVDSNFQAEFKVWNSSKRVTNKILHKALPGNMQKIRKFTETLLPPSLFKTVLKTYINYKRVIFTASTNSGPRPPMPLELKQHLKLEFKDEVKQLSELLDRDLTYWSNSQ